MSIERAKTERVKRLVSSLLSVMDYEDLESFYIFHKTRELNKFNAEDLKSLEDSFKLNGGL
jgi:hypothetical protein